VLKSIAARKISVIF